MDFLLRPCQSCHKPMNGGVYRASHVCPHCLFEHEGGKNRKRHKMAVAQMGASPVLDEHPVNQQQYAASAYSESDMAAAAQAGVAREEQEAAAHKAVTVVLSAKPAADHPVLEDCGEVAAECVLNLKVTPDMINDGKFIGTKSDKVKAALEQGKKHVLAQLRQKAQEHGANLVAGIAVKNSVKAADAQAVKMLVRATGTAVIADLALETSEI